MTTLLKYSTKLFIDVLMLVVLLGGCLEHSVISNDLARSSEAIPVNFVAGDFNVVHEFWCFAGEIGGCGTQ